MASVSERMAVVLGHEERFAESLASAVLDKPRLSVWMILIPIIFVYFLYQHQKYIAGKKMFAENYLTARRHALEGALSLVEKGVMTGISGQERISSLPEGVRERHEELMEVLALHYGRLLRAEGGDYPALVRSAYGDRDGYFVFLNRLNAVERSLNEALMPVLESTHGAVGGITAAMESHSERLRAEEAESIFM